MNRAWVTMVAAVLLVSQASQAPAQSFHLDVPDYHWWRGCTPTSVGMIMGWYDRAGYKGGDYSNLVPGGVAEFSTHVRWLGIGDWVTDEDARATKAIASTGHYNDFWGVDDYNGRPLDCIADFLGTSKYPEHNGVTDILSDQATNGIGDYVKYCGYGGARAENRVLDIYGGDFTYEDFKAEINAGRPVLLMVEGEYCHSMVGYGYDESGGVKRVMLHDTWEPGRHTMWWGGAYETTGIPLIFPAETAYLTRVTTIVIDGADLRTSPAHRGVLDFGHVLVGRTSQKTITATNAGRPYLDGTPNDLTGEWFPPWAGNPDFGRVPTPSTFTVAATQECTQDYSYAPANRGTDSNPIMVTSNHGQSTITLSGTGVAPVAQIADMPAGRVRIGTTRPCYVMVRNSGNGNCAGLEDPQLMDESCLRGTMDGTNGGDFSGPGGIFVLMDAYGSGIPGQEDFAYTYRPTGHGAGQRVVQCHFDNGWGEMNQAHTADLVLTGTGVGPTYSADSAPGATLDFGNVLLGGSGLLEFEISNVSLDDNGGSSALTDLTVLGLELSGPDASMFAAPDLSGTDPGTIVLHNGEQWALDLVFTPTGSAGEKLASLSILTDEGAALGSPGERFVYQLKGLQVPEPASLVLLALGGLALVRRRRMA